MHWLSMRIVINTFSVNYMQPSHFPHKQLKSIFATALVVGETILILS